MATRKRPKRSSVYIRRRRRERIIISVTALVVIVIGFIAVKASMSMPYETVDLTDLCTVEYEGYDGAGSASAYVDDDAVDDLLSAVKQDYEDALFHSKEPDNEDYLKFRQSLEVSVDGGGNLTNGSIINMSCSYDEELAELLNIEVAANTRQITVGGLTNVQLLSIDELFADLDVSFEGVSPNLTISMQNKSQNPFIQRVSFEIAEPKEYYSAGDEVTVKAVYLDEASTETGYAVDASMDDCIKTYEATADSEYISGAASLPDSILEEAISAGKNAFKDANEYGVRIFCEANLVPVYIDKKATFVYGTPQVVSAYFKSVLPANAGQLGYDYNDLDIIYSVNITQADGVSCTAYAAVRFSDIVKNGDGSYEYDFSNPKILSESYYAARVKSNVTESYESDYTVEKVK